MGIYMNKKGRWVKCSIYSSQSVVWTYSYILWTNSLATFQTMINKIIWDLINTGEVVNFIDNIIVGTEEKKGHDKVVEKVVNNLAKNDLYVNWRSASRKWEK